MSISRHARAHELAGAEDQPRSTRPGDPSFQGERAGALRVVEGALVVVNGVMGVEVRTARVWKRPTSSASRALVFVNMLDRERADFYRTLGPAPGAALGPLRRRPPPDRRRARAHGDRRRPPHVRLHDAGRRQGGRAERRFRTRCSRSRRSTARSCSTRSSETDEALMERYLDGEELDRDEVAAALKHGDHAAARSSRSPAASRRRTSAPTRCSTCSSRACRRRPGRARPIERSRSSADEPARLRLQDARRPVRGPDQPLPRPQGCRHRRLARSSTSAATPRSASGQLLQLQGKEQRPADGVRRGRHRRRREAQGGPHRRSARPTARSTSTCPRSTSPTR